MNNTEQQRACSTGVNLIGPGELHLLCFIVCGSGGRNPRTNISHKLPGTAAAAAAGPGVTLQETLKFRLEFQYGSQRG